VRADTQVRPCKDVGDGGGGEGDGGGGDDGGGGAGGNEGRPYNIIIDLRPIRPIRLL